MRICAFSGFSHDCKLKGEGLRRGRGFRRVNKGKTVGCVEMRGDGGLFKGGWNAKGCRKWRIKNGCRLEGFGNKELESKLEQVRGGGGYWG